ncbi:Efflux ABC transporter, permease/ATP-binding protein [hydrothermal vent metagenome]|uniref:Efflux ABC transporter, permease/ATP-binding protein n=1 Tax=hydrothermal vent metagenome TaxID=652676 RepID=A0A3B1C4L6_9ZZZZ
MDLYKRLLAYLKPYRKRFIIASVCMVVVSATAGAAALIIQPILDDIFMNGNEDMLLLLPIGVIGIYCARGIGRYFASSIMQTIGQLAVRDIRNDLFSRLQRLSLNFYSSKETGQIISRVTNDVQLIQDAVSIVVYDLFRESLTMIVLLGVVFYRDFNLAIMAIIVLPFSGILIGRLGRSLRVISKESQEAMADINTMLVETFAGIRIVQAFGMEEYEIKRFKERNMRYFDTIRRTIKINELSSPLLEFIGAFGIAAIIWYGGRQVIDGHTTVGAFFSFLTALFMLYAPISKLSRSNNKIQQAMAAAKRIFDMMDTEVMIKDKAGAVDIPPLQKQVEFKNVNFHYENGSPILSNINLTAKKGEIIAFAGQSGAGKTTIVNLVPRFYDAVSGAILFDGVDIRDATIASLRKQIGIVTQEIFLFNDTISANIAYGDLNASREEIERAARAAFAHDFIMESPQGYDTIIGERGVKLSGGQRQRLSIARAIMKNPAILILDEATSALDTESEQAVQKALANLMKGRTTFVIAHRLSTILDANKIVVMEKGRIIETGSHDSLMAEDGNYRKLFELQFNDKIKTIK